MNEEMRQYHNAVAALVNDPASQEKYKDDSTFQATQMIHTLHQFIETQAESIKIRENFIELQKQRIKGIQFTYNKAMNAIEVSDYMFEQAMCGDEEDWEEYKGLLSALLMLGLCHEDDRALLSMSLKEAKDKFGQLEGAA